MGTKIEAIAIPRKGPATPVPEGAQNKSHEQESSSNKPLKKGDGKTSAATSFETLYRQLTTETIRRGVPVKKLHLLEKFMGMSKTEALQTLDIPTSTYSRRAETGRFSSAESDRLARVVHLRKSVLGMMQGDDQATNRWLTSPLEILGNESPLQHADTEFGAREVTALIGRIRHGVFS